MGLCWGVVMSMEKVKQSLVSHQVLMTGLNDAFCDKVKVMGHLIGDTLDRGHRIWIAGNGGCASLAQYFTNALAHRSRRERAPHHVVCLSSDVTLLTGIANALGFENIYKRQLEARASEGDLFIAFDAMGRANNLRRAIEFGVDCNVQTFAIVGAGGGSVGDCADHVMVIPSTDVGEVHFVQMWAINTMCQLVEAHS